MYNGDIENNIPIIRNGTNKVLPKLVSRKSHTLLKIKTDAITRISS